MLKKLFIISYDEDFFGSDNSLQDKFKIKPEEVLYWLLGKAIDGIEKIIC